MLYWRNYVFALSVAASFHVKLRLSLCKNTERISTKITGGDQYNEQIKRLDFGRNLNNNKGAGYERKSESMSIDFAAMSNRWCHLASKFTNFTSQMKADTDIILS